MIKMIDDINIAKENANQPFRFSLFETGMEIVVEIQRIINKITFSITVCMAKND